MGCLPKHVLTVTDRAQDGSQYEQAGGSPDHRGDRTRSTGPPADECERDGQSHVHRAEIAQAVDRAEDQQRDRDSKLSHGGSDEQRAQDPDLVHATFTTGGCVNPRARVRARPRPRPSRGQPGTAGQVMRSLLPGATVATAVEMIPDLADRHRWELAVQQRRERQPAGVTVHAPFSRLSAEKQSR